MSKDIEFTYKSGGKSVMQTLLWKDRQSSSWEAISIWHIGNYTWKLYSAKDNDQHKTLEKLREDYHWVDAHGLPMGKPRFQDGTIKQGNGHLYSGMVLIVDWFKATNFHRPPSCSSYRKYMYILMLRIKAGCGSAEAVGLQDCQGYVKTGRIIVAIASHIVYSVLVANEVGTIVSAVSI
ncbi:hypothetical protein BKA83DRAFT_4125542 [Pisolithus microcarpus]|nr:hypothetical protein BKA83DRAFT_4125542 [Pisolithus microcarpus]